MILLFFGFSQKSAIFAASKTCHAHNHRANILAQLQERNK